MSHSLGARLSRPETRWLSGGFLLVLCSGFGQTYFIAIFSGYLKHDLALTDGEFGSLYMIATLASGTLLGWTGKLADSVAIRLLGAGILAGLALAALGMAATSSAPLLLLSFFGLRFFGQGMLTHTAMTAMSRWFERGRGKAISIAAIGFPVGEAVLPLAAVTLAGFAGWRTAWLTVAALLLLVPLPLLMILLRHEPGPDLTTGHAGAAGREWTRGEVLRSPCFYALMPVILAQPFIQTGIFFYQVTLVEAKDWDLARFAAAYPVLAGTSMLTALAAGWLVDRIGAWRLLPVYLVPLGLATLVLALASAPLALPAVMALIGMTAGCASTVTGAMWAEMYGTRHLGAIRALVTAGIVLATSLAPGLMGLLLDAGIRLESQLLAMAGYCFAAAAWMSLLAPRLRGMRQEGEDSRA